MKYFTLFLLVAACSSSGPHFAEYEPTILTKYEELMGAHPAKEKIFECKRPDISKHKKATEFKTRVNEQLPLMVRPNFNGTYFLVEVPMTGGSLWLINDCKTGILSKSDFSGHLAFSYDSSIVVKNPPGAEETFKTYQKRAHGLPEVWQWSGENFFQLENKVQSK